MSAAREAIASKLWLSVPSTDNDQARRIAERMLDAYRAEVLREAAEKIRNSPSELLALLRERYGYGAPDVDHAWSAAIFLADLIDPDKDTP